MHQVSPPPFENWWPDDWAAFIAAQRKSYAARHRELCLPSVWTDQLPRFLDDVALASGPPVLLHPEIRRPHLLAVQAHGGAWRLSRLVDFDISAAPADTISSRSESTWPRVTVVSCAGY